ncbi:SDR family oxidoreductase [Frigidibacter albus]|uniref:SDR family oxidoreductase n=1 Tax=Frigidibacter albus TaxID=1465486 RepID=A0A6L8VBC6_9RHOB|nr:SDR family oxidoreductase [Frigidibacter albus]MZQ87575.1 SDR family oxidoreductase [Frigidibacter albus]NBE29481.1 SDR family oxidoreductase [Frigidibacter albus]GGH44618.1 3-oxoacyl-ACP reductase [Frigidibacter albus]
MTDRTTPIALITGGSRGLGRNTALHLARKGCDVALTYHSRKDEAEATVAEIAALGRKAVALRLDTAKTAGFADFTTRLQSALTDLRGEARLDFLVNNAGTGINVPFADTTETQFDDMMAVHLKGVFFLTQGMLPLIRGGGKIVNISSGLARFSLPGYSAYAAMKGGVEVMTRYLAKELGPRGISVNVVAPGAIETDFGGGVVRDVTEVNQYIASQTAMGRVGLPDDIGGAISSLLMGDMTWVTGQRIEVSGGMFL